MGSRRFMKNRTPISAGIIAAIALLALSSSGCGHSQNEPGTGANGAAPPPVSSLTPQQQEATQAAQQRESAERGAADRQQQTQHH